MEYQERLRTLRRITSGKFLGIFVNKNIEYPLVFNDPSLDIMNEAEYIYENECTSGQIQGIMTVKESYELLKIQGLWSDKQQKQLDTLYSDIKLLNEDILSSKFQKKKQEKLKELIKDGKVKIASLEKTKGQLWASTLEYMCDFAKKRFIAQKCTTFRDSKNQELLFDKYFLDNLIVYLYSENHVSEEIVRELARTEPWRLYWTVSKGTGTPLLTRSCVEMTDLQYSLLLWTKIYDFAYESTNRPSDEIIKDDSKFDAWYEEEIKRIEQQTQTNNIGGMNGGSEVYLPADSEGAKEIYKMNTPDAKRRIAQRQAAIAKKGTVNEAELPDIKNDLAIELRQRS